ncbi:MAG: adenosine deaminase [Clostridia bacterium]|nr:adenosine deaminase [Clostridia bacterium]
MRFGRLYLDSEKDMIVDLDLKDRVLSYTISTPNHNSGNLITNFAKLLKLPISFDRKGLKVIKGTVPSYIDQYNNILYILRLGNTKVANIYPDGRIEMKAGIPAISKTLMSQTKDYKLDEWRTLVKTYILEDAKFRTDLHTHMNANLPSDTLIAMGIVHQIRYPYYYVKKLGLKLTAVQRRELEAQRKTVKESFKDSVLKGKYLERRIDDNTFINFADLILNNLDHAEENINRIRNSLCVLKDGQAVFTNLEKVYLYRYVFTKGKTSDKTIKLKNIRLIPDSDVREKTDELLRYRKRPEYRNNSIFQDKLLLIAREYASQGIQYAEISDTTLVKKSDSVRMLREVHEVMPYIYRETGVMIRFLAAMRRIPLTIVKDSIVKEDYLAENIRILRTIAEDPYVAGSDFVGEEITDITELKNAISELVKIADEVPSFTIRIHAGENDSLKDNVINSILCVKDSLRKGQKMPYVRIGHGLYTPNLRSRKGKELIELIKETKTILEFQITSNVRLNNLNQLSSHPIKEYLRNGVYCVQGTDGGALYGTNTIEEELSLERLLGLTHEDLLKMRKAEEAVIKEAKTSFLKKEQLLKEKLHGKDLSKYYSEKQELPFTPEKELFDSEAKYASDTVFADRIRELPSDRIPVILVGGSFNNDTHRTVMKEQIKYMIEDLLEGLDPKKVFFVIGHRGEAYEKYLMDNNRGRFEIYSFVPSMVSEQEKKKIDSFDSFIRVSIEPVGLGTYKSIAYEIFKRRESVLLAVDGNAAGANLIQEARNARYRCQKYINESSRSLKEKAQSLGGYVTMFSNRDNVSEMVIRYIDENY